MEVQELTWNKIYEYLKAGSPALYFYPPEEKYYYSISNNFCLNLHKTMRRGIIRFVALLRFTTKESFIHHMSNHPYSIDHISPLSRLKLCTSPNEVVEIVPRIRARLRLNIIKVLGETQFKSLHTLFNEKGLNGDYSHIRITNLELALIGGIMEIYDGYMPGIENVFFLYDQLTSPEYISGFYE